ncbi:MAG: KH domain-containing protein [Coriobacteriia bacterium]|nr:KH domain-containing protein [Coriobacteriia bacterium]
MSSAAELGIEERVKGLVCYIVEGLVDNPDDVSVETTLEDKLLSLFIQSHPDDVGKIIGRNGRTIKSIRTLARASVGSPSMHLDIDVEG